MYLFGFVTSRLTNQVIMTTTKTTTSTKATTQQDVSHHSLTTTTKTTAVTTQHGMGNSSSSSSTTSPLAVEEIDPSTTMTTTTTRTSTRTKTIFGHLHYAKTAGTTINGELAARYERVCGNKGYSYDAYQFNQRVQNQKLQLQQQNSSKAGVLTVIKAGGNDIIRKSFGNYNRGRIPHNVMDEIGFEDCDYISLEQPWHRWIRFANPYRSSPQHFDNNNNNINNNNAVKDHTNIMRDDDDDDEQKTRQQRQQQQDEDNWNMELHVPCREPLAHLMSQCNFQHVKFNCSAHNLTQEILHCLVSPKRFAQDLIDLDPQHYNDKNNNTHRTTTSKTTTQEDLSSRHHPSLVLKCFDPFPVQRYLSYMDHYLQPKHRPVAYVHRHSNSVRRKDDECLWKPQYYATVAKTVRRIMKETLPYYRWCHDCLQDSQRNLLFDKDLVTTTTITTTQG